MAAPPCLQASPAPGWAAGRAPRPPGPLVPAASRPARAPPPGAVAVALGAATFVAACGARRGRRPGRGRRPRVAVALSPGEYLVDTSLAASAALDAGAIQRAPQVLGTLAAAILCHEGGHYFCAASVGLPAVEFSLGFGPTVLSSRSQSSIAERPSLPDDSLEFKDMEDDTVCLQRWGDTVFVLVNGEATWNGMPVLDRSSGELNCGGGLCVVPEGRREEVNRILLDTRAAADPEDTEFTVRALPIGGYVRFSEQKLFEGKDGKMVSQFESLPAPAQLWVLAGGVLANVVTAWTSLAAAALTIGVPDSKPLPGIRVEEVSQEAFARTGLAANDVMMRIGARDLSAPGQSTKDAVKFIQALPPQETVSVLVERAGKELTLDVMPVTDAATGLQKLGVMINTNVEKFVTRAADLPEAAGVASATIERMLGEQVAALQGLLGGAGSSGEIVGPVGILKQGADMTESQGIVGLGMFFVSVNLNLALLNALPIPALDGGKAAFVVANEVSGQRVDQKTKEDVEIAFVFLVILGLASLTVKDVTKVFKF